MPKLSDAQIRGDAGERWFAAQLPDGWLMQKPSIDVGVDGVIVICEPGILNNLEFRVQVKTSRRFAKRTGEIAVRKLNVEAVRYWFASPTPMLLVAYDQEAKIGYFGWHDELIADPHKLFQSGQSTVSVNLKTSNTLSGPGWQSIRSTLHEYYVSMARAFHRSEFAGFLVPILHELTTQVRHLVGVQFSPFREEDTPKAVREGTCKEQMLSEVSVHRKIVATINVLIGRFCEIPALHDWMADFLVQYQAHVSSFIVNFSDLPVELHAECEIVVDRKTMHSRRPVIIAALLDIIRLLSYPAKSKEDAANTCAAIRPFLSVPRRADGHVIDIVKASVAELGFPEGATTSQLIGTERDTDQHGNPAPFTLGRGNQLGLQLCPPEVGPILRAEYKNQPLNERLHVAMKPIAASGREPAVFVVENNADGMLLDAARARPDDMWQSGDLFVFCKDHENTQDASPRLP